MPPAVFNRREQRSHFEMFRFLMGNENLQVVEVALAVIAPWSLELLLEVWIPLAFFGHCEGGRLSGSKGIKLQAMNQCHVVERRRSMLISAM